MVRKASGIPLCSIPNCKGQAKDFDCPVGQSKKPERSPEGIQVGNQELICQNPKAVWNHRQRQINFLDLGLQEPVCSQWQRTLGPVQVRRKGIPQGRHLEALCRVRTLQADHEAPDQGRPRRQILFDQAQPEVPKGGNPERQTCGGPQEVQGQFQGQPQSLFPLQPEGQARQSQLQGFQNIRPPG